MMNKSAKTIFLSRELEADSPFHKLSQQGHTVIAQSLIDFEYLDFELEESYGAVFFYSRNGIKAYFSKQDYDSKVAYGVMGVSSHKTFLNITGHNATVVGGDIDSLANMINNLWKDHTILFPLAAHSIHSLKDKLTDCHCHTVVVYNNTPKENIEIPHCDLYLLTSPMNARTLLSNEKIGINKLLAIGSTTARAISKLTGVTPLYCSEPSIENLYLLAYTKI